MRFRGRWRQLAVLLETAEQRTQARMAEALRPRLVATLEEVGMVPRNLPERVAQRKVVEELIDQITDRGYLSMGDLRDTISRNNLKLRDFPGFSSLLTGDQLLEADRRLADALAGVYRRGEIYLRLPQSLSSLAFGTPAGRFLTRYAILPFGGAFIGLYALEHLVDLARGRLGHRNRRTEFCTPGSVLLLGRVHAAGCCIMPRFATRAGLACAISIAVPAGWSSICRLQRYGCLGSAGWLTAAAFPVAAALRAQAAGVQRAAGLSALSLVPRHNIALRTDA